MPEFSRMQGVILKVFIAEDCTVVRESLCAMLSRIAGVVVVGFAEDEAGAIDGIETLLPDVVILDLHLKQGTGLNVLLKVKKRHAAIKIMVLSNCVSVQYIDTCKRAGTDYFFDKSFQFMLAGKALEQLMSLDRFDGKTAG